MESVHFVWVALGYYSVFRYLIDILSKLGKTVKHIAVHCRIWDLLFVFRSLYALNV